MTNEKRIYLVIDETGEPIHSASWPEACHEHINEAIEEDLDGAGKWTVREAELLPTKPTPCWCPFCGEPHGVDRHD